MSKSLTFCCLLAFLPAIVSAAEKDAESAIRAAINSYVEAFNAADAKRVAEHWADDAEYRLPSGERVQGREAIQKAFVKTFSGDAPPKIDLVEARIRLVSKDVAIEEGVVRVLVGDDTPEETGYLAVHVLQGKQWKLSTVHETTLPKEHQSASYEQLKDLHWLVGHWQEKAGESVADVPASPGRSIAPSSPASSTLRSPRARHSRERR